MKKKITNTLIIFFLLAGAVLVPAGIARADVVTTNDNNQILNYDGDWSYDNHYTFSTDTHISTTTNDFVSFEFYGQSIALFSVLASDQGQADVYIDSVFKQTIDLYAATNTYDQSIYTSDTLTITYHTIMVVVKGTKNASSSGYGINIDYFRFDNAYNLGLPETNELQCYSQEDPTHVTCSQIDTQHIQLIGTNEDPHYDPRWQLIATNQIIYAKLTAISVHWWASAFSDTGSLYWNFDVKAEYGGGGMLNGADKQGVYIGQYYPSGNKVVVVQEMSGQESLSGAGVYHTGTQLQYKNHLNQWGIWGSSNSSWVLDLQTRPFESTCVDQYDALMTTGPFIIDPTVEDPSEETTTEQMQTLTVNKTYIIRIGGDAWHDNSATDRIGVEYAYDGDDIWHNLQTEPSCVSMTEGYYFYSAVITAPDLLGYRIGGAPLMLRANDLDDNFANNYMDANEHFTYIISEVLTYGQLTCDSQFSYDEEEDLIASFSLPANTPYAHPLEPEVTAGDWYAIQIESGAWQDDGAPPDRYDAQYNWGLLVGDNTNLWQPLDATGVGNYCAVTDGNYVMVYTQAANDTMPYLRVFDENETFTANTGALVINIYQVSFTRRPNTCELTYSIDSFATHDEVMGIQENGITAFAKTTLTPGGWYMIETTDGPWGFVGDGQTNISYDLQIMYEGDWIPLETWPSATCNVEIDSLGHRRAYFQAPGGTVEYQFRVADTSSWSNNMGSMGIDLYRMINGGQSLPDGSCDYVYDDDTAIFEDNILATAEDGELFPPLNGLEAGSIYAWVIKGSTSHWHRNGEDPTEYHEMQISDSFNEEGLIWSDLPEGYGPVLCYFQDNDDTVMFMQAGANYFYRMRVDPYSPSDIYSDNIGSMDVAIYAANAGDTINPWEPCTYNAILPAAVPFEWIDVRAEDGESLEISENYLNDDSVIGWVVKTLDGPWADGETETQHYDAELSADNGATWGPLDSRNENIICAKKYDIYGHEEAYFSIQEGQIWKIRVNDEDTDMFDDNTGNLAYSLYAVTESGMPDCLVDTNDYRCIPWDETPGGVYWWDQDDNGSDTSGICYGASTRPVAPTSIDIPDWLSWVGNWLSYGIEYIVRYFAWCPWHTSAIIGMGQTFRSKDPIASIIEIDQVLTEVQTQLTGYNWSDSDQNETGLIVSSEGGAESAEATSTSLLDRIFPTGSSPWNGGPLITGLQEWTGNSHYDNCVSNYGELLDNEGLTAGTCFVSSAMDLIGVSFLFQLMLELAAVAFLINDFIAQIKNTASFMSGGSMQGAQYGEGPYADHTYDD